MVDDAMKITCTRPSVTTAISRVRTPYHRNRNRNIVPSQPADHEQFRVEPTRHDEARHEQQDYIRNQERGPRAWCDVVRIDVFRRQEAGAKLGQPVVLRERLERGEEDPVIGADRGGSVDAHWAAMWTLSAGRGWCSERDSGAD